MALFTINIDNAAWWVKPLDIIETECSTIFSFEIFAENSDDISIALTGDHRDEYYVLNGTVVPFTDTVPSISFNNTLTIHFNLENSNDPGYFDNTTLTIDNNTVVGYNKYVNTLERPNDSPRCVTAVAADYDTLDDTPSSKVGHGLKYIRVNAGETEHEYIAGGLDKHYEHDQPIASASWNINHALGTFPSVTIIDTSDNEVVGEVNYVDNNNIILTFSASFAGKAYLN